MKILSTKNEVLVLLYYHCIYRDKRLADETMEERAQHLKNCWPRKYNYYDKPSTSEFSDYSPIAQR